MLDKYKKELAELDESIPKMESLIGRPFEKDVELKQMKAELIVLEKEISEKIKGNMAKQNVVVETTPDLEMEAEEIEQQQEIGR